VRKEPMPLLSLGTGGWGKKVFTRKNTHLPWSKIMVKGSFFVVNDSLTTFCLSWSIDRYRSCFHSLLTTMVDASL
jgi:hypothetical protein